MKARMSTKIVVQRRIKVDLVKAIPDMADEMQEEAIEMGAERARFYVPKVTWWLHDHIFKLSKSGFGTRVRYGGYVEDGTQYMSPRRYLARALDDVLRAFPSISHKGFYKGMSRN